VAHSAASASGAATAESKSAAEHSGKKETAPPATTSPEHVAGKHSVESASRPKVPRPADEASPLAAADGGDGTGDGGGSGPGSGAGSVVASWKEPARRRPVVFDEDDDLDVPDFLK
jgi:cell division protein FtsZ